MICNEAAEYVSALADGEIIPPEAANHIGACDTCRARLNEYIAMGAELRRVASAEMNARIPALPIEKRRATRTLWQKGWETMRIPKLAFALLVLAVVALASSLTFVKVGARSEGNVVFLKMDAGADQPLACPLSTVDKHYDVCMFTGAFNGVFAEYRIKLLDRDSNRIRFDFRSKVLGPAHGSHTFSPFDLDHAAGQEYWFTPGETLKIDVPQTGSISITGEWMDHIPVMPSGKNQAIDPAVDELRIVSPLLLRDNTVVGDLKGAISNQTQSVQAAWLYYPGQGDFTISLTQMQDSVPARVEVNRLAFQHDGHSYEIVTGAPVARASQVWVLHRPDFRPADRNTADGAFSGSVNLKQNSTGEWTTPIPLR